MADDSRPKVRCVFVHGLSGWGFYDERYRKIPYWGMRGLNLIRAFRALGYDAYAASVSPQGSAWDRACELYAQLAGSRVDYGRAHAERMGHARYGRDYSSCPLIDSWDDDVRLVLVGHSFGGATIRLFTELMERGDERERSVTGDGTLSALFAGGMGGRVRAVCCIAASLNGNAVYTMLEDPAFDETKVRAPLLARVLSRRMSRAMESQRDGRLDKDWADFDMHIDEALRMNERMPELPHVYYISVPCCLTNHTAKGTDVPDGRMEPFLKLRSAQLGAYEGITEGGYRIDESWHANDGRLSCVSAAYPFGSPHRPFDPEHLEAGVWNVHDVYRCDHIQAIGGLVHTFDIRFLYAELLSAIAKALEGDAEAEAVG